MNDIDELKQFVVAHARVQNIPRETYTALLGRIAHDDGDSPGSWVAEWSRAAEALERQGKPLEACRHYNMARFPYVDGPARREALNRCVANFDQWRHADPDIQPLEIEVDGGRVRCWTSGLSADHPKPVLLGLGGIVSVKEQWGPILTNASKLGMAGVVTEMPGVGENTLRYTADSWQMLSAVLDALGTRANTAQTYAVALSFSGHMALRCALEDPRIRGIVTAGAPVDAFFTDTAWRQRIPRVTVDTLAHLTGTDPSLVGEHISGWALTSKDLRRLDIPVSTIVSRRDEIVPARDPELLREHVGTAYLLENDDVHGSPSHADESRLWTVLSLLRMRGGFLPQRAVLRGVLGATRTRHRLFGVRT